MKYQKDLYSLFKEGNRSKNYSYNEQHIKNSDFNIPIFPINLSSLGSSYHIALLTKYAATKLIIQQKILIVNKISFAFFRSALIGKITAAPTHPAAKFMRKSAKIPDMILSIFLNIHFSPENHWDDKEGI